MKVGDIFYHDDFGKKIPYRVLKVNEDGTYFSELVIGVVEKPIQDIVEEIKEKNATPKAEVKKPTAKKPIKKK